MVQRLKQIVRNELTIALGVLTLLNIFVGVQIIGGAPNEQTELYFMDVGQGDAQLVLLPNNVKLLIDGGPNNNLLNELNEIIPKTDRYLDLVLLSHPQTDHFNGLIELLKRYRVGLFISNGRTSEVKSFQELQSVLKEKRIPTVTLQQGDAIRYQTARADIIAPTQKNRASNELNDTSIVMKLTADGVAALFTGDIGFVVEEELAQFKDIKTDILKVAHHGSKYSSSAAFLAAAAPTLAIIEVGKNSYGHPTSEAMQRIETAGAKLLRTDTQGTIKLVLKDGSIKVFMQSTDGEIPGF